MKTYNVFILSYDGKTKLYYNRILAAWSHHRGNASPFFEEDDAKFLEHLPFGMKKEVVW